MNDNYIVINGIKHVLVPDNRTSYLECKDCSLREDCNNIIDGSICMNIFNKARYHFEIQK